MSAATVSVESLVADALTGDEQAWRTIVDRYAGLIWAVCRSHRLADADAADVAQTVYLRLVEHLPAIRTSAALPGWIGTTTRRECLRCLRESAGRGVPGAEELLERTCDPAAPDVADGLLAAECRAALREAFDELSQRCRELLALVLAEDPPSYAQVSELTGRPVGAIGPTRSRCLDQLRKSAPLQAWVGRAGW